MTIFENYQFNNNFEPKNCHYRQLKADKMRVKLNFAENWNNEA
jgi:hypothetical protein